MRHRLPLLGLAILLLSTGCEERPKDQIIADPEGPAKAESQRQEMLKAINELAYGKDPANTEHSKRYDDARDRLIRRGSGIEHELIDELRRSDDWAVRYGLVEVLQATGTRACVPHLIAVLDDPEPLVAYMANQALVEMTKHSEIPGSGGTAPNGLPPVPKRDPKNLDLDAEQQLWATWQRVHGGTLRSAWDGWWTTNKDEIAIR